MTYGTGWIVTLKHEAFEQYYQVQLEIVRKMYAIAKPKDASRVAGTRVGLESRGGRKGQSIELKEK